MDFSDDPEAEIDGRDLELQIEQVAAHPEPDGNLRVMLRTTRGEIRGILHPCATGPAAAVYAGGAMGGFEGPAHDLYGRLADRLRPAMSTLRIHYRQPGEFVTKAKAAGAKAITIKGFASPEGTAAHNQTLAGQRGDKVRASLDTKFADATIVVTAAVGGTLSGQSTQFPRLRRADIFVTTPGS